LSCPQAKQSTRVVDHSKLSQSPPSTKLPQTHTTEIDTDTERERERVHTIHYTHRVLRERERGRESRFKAQSFVAFLLLLLRFDREKEKRYTKV
jgi:hypothetical protein